MISGQWFYRRFFKKWPKIAQNYPLFNKNRGNTLILTNLLGVLQQNIHTEFEANLCSGLKEVKKVKKFTMETTDRG